MEKLIEIVVVGKRAVYINDTRVAGRKPYVSENIPEIVFSAKFTDIFDAFSLDDLHKAVEDRQAKRNAKT